MIPSSETVVRVGNLEHRLEPGRGHHDPVGTVLAPFPARVEHRRAPADGLMGLESGHRLPRWVVHYRTGRWRSGTSDRGPRRAYAAERAVGDLGRTATGCTHSLEATAVSIASFAVRE